MTITATPELITRSGSLCVIKWTNTATGRITYTTHQHRNGRLVSRLSRPFTTADDAIADMNRRQDPRNDANV